MSFEDFQLLPPEEARARLLQCCHCVSWADHVATRRAGYPSLSQLQAFAREHFLSLGEKEWLEAFAAHPKIGDVGSLKAKYASTARTASGEQSGVQGASEFVLLNLKRLNEEYERKHGFLFLVFATGKTAAEMLAMLESRIGNPRPKELRNAAEEQAEILTLRMEKFL